MKKIALGLYSLIWWLALPLLRLNPRLREGFGQRTLRNFVPGHADLWIQAASVGEAFLALEIVKELKPAHPIHILMTSNTSQGIAILTEGARDCNRTDIALHIAYFPFDRPGIMDRAVQRVGPALMVLLEAELWPGLLSACKKHGAKVLLLNGRITPKSLSRYLVWPALWRGLRPDKTLAMSRENQERFAALFGREHVGQMHNMKFDRLSNAGPEPPREENKPAAILRNAGRFVVLGSVRQEEEGDIADVVADISRNHPDVVVGLFPRHMHRIDHWQKTLTALNLPWMLRSAINTPVADGTIILWDTFGELTLAYGLANAVFIGGSLAPVGGQNFLEPLTRGIKPITGPHWKNFDWVGREIITSGLVREVQDKKELCRALTESLESPLQRDRVRKAAMEYVRDRQGGTRTACQAINNYLNGRQTKTDEVVGQ